MYHKDALANIHKNNSGYDKALHFINYFSKY